MKSFRNLIIVALTLACSSSLLAHLDGKAGPNGGRILSAVTPPVEFFVTPERKIQFTFLDEHGQAIAPAAQTVTVTTGSRSAPTVLKFSRQGNVLLSETALPEGNNLPAVIQLKPTPEATEIVHRLNINLAVCSECKHAEYACICGH